MTPLEKLHKDFMSLSDVDKQAFLEGIVAHSAGLTDLSQVKADIDEINKKHCPHCQSSSIVANGKCRGTQRYRCNKCGKNFSENTGTSLSKDSTILYLFNELPRGRAPKYQNNFSCPSYIFS